MPNGVAVALTPALDPACVKVTTPTEIEQQIGEAVADAAIAVCVGVEEFQDGGLTGATRVRAGDLFVQLYRLQQDTIDKIDFDAVARAEGKRVLWERHAAVMRTQLRFSETTLDAALDELVDRPLDVLRKVTAVERAWAN
jgi:hypothetical protein